MGSLNYEELCPMSDYAVSSSRQELLKTSFVSGEDAAYIARICAQFLADRTALMPVGVPTLKG